MAWSYERLGWITSDEIAQAHRDAAEELKVEVAPAGVAWQRSIRERPEIDLYAPDRDGYLSYTFLYEYECTRGRYRFMRSEYFPGRMADGIGYSESEPSKYFVTPKAATVDARIMRRVCAAVLN
jgi:hypothetical protein